MISELLNGWAKYLLGSTIIIILYIIVSTWWDIYKHRSIIKRLDNLERLLKEYK